MRSSSFCVHLIKQCSPIFILLVYLGCLFEVTGDLSGAERLNSPVRDHAGFISSPIPKAFTPLPSPHVLHHRGQAQLAGYFQDEKKEVLCCNHIINKNRRKWTTFCRSVQHPKQLLFLIGVLASTGKLPFSLCKSTDTPRINKVTQAKKGELYLVTLSPRRSPPFLQTRAFPAMSSPPHPPKWICEKQNKTTRSLFIFFSSKLRACLTSLACVHAP